MHASNEKLNAHRRKVLWRAQHRGMKEMDILLGSYAREKLAGMNEETLREFERLIGLLDGDLHDWFIKGVPVPDELAGELVDDIKAMTFTLDALRDLQ